MVSMANDGRNATYGGLAGDAYRSLIGAAEGVNAGAIAYVRSLLAIVTKPYHSYHPSDLAKEQIARSAAMLAATLDVVEANNAHAAGLARDLAGVVSDAHENYVASLRDIVQTRKAPRAYPLPSVN
jgi:hypothetical protein